LYVERDWLLEGRASVATVVGAIVDALGQLADEPKCILVKKAQSGSEASLVSTIVSCGPHAVRIAVVTRSEQPSDSVSIEETWKRPR